MNIITKWLRAYLPELPVDDAQLAEDLTLRGIAVEGTYNLGPGNGTLYEMDITTNRVDAMNHYGVAREAAAIYNVELKKLGFAMPAAKPASKPFPVRIEATDGCGRYTARVLRNVKLVESRDWFAGGEVDTYFKLLEQKKISNAVDATNFAWLSIGQPTHVFDLDKIEGGIVVRRAAAGEKLKTLDGAELTLDAEDLVIADERKALCLAGVMGGWDSMVTPETKNILVESAWFDPMSVRRSSRRHGLHTDSSHRYERGADIQACPLASDLVCSFILASGGELEGELVDVQVPELMAKTAHRAPVTLTLSEVHRHLGTTLDPEGITAPMVETIVKALGCEVEKAELAELAKGADAAWNVTLPSWRLDMEREIDLIEEVARVYGYNRFANTLPTFAGGIRVLPWAESEKSVRQTMLAAGFHEAIGSTFCSAADAALAAPQPGLVVPLGNPLSEEAGVMRPSLVPGLLTAASGNLNRDVSDVLLFELGTVFSGSTEKVDERPALGFAAAGTLPERGGMGAARALAFYDVKGAVEAVLSRFQAKSVYFDRFPADAGITPGWLHPYRAARVVADGSTVGWFGQLHPREASARKIKAELYLGELYLDRLYKLTLRKPACQELSRFQAVRRDFSLILDQHISWEKIDQALKALGIPELVEWRPREIFRDAKLGQDYSLLLGTTFQATDRTLRDEELQSFQEQVVAAVGKVGARLRG